MRCSEVSAGEGQGSKGASLKRMFRMFLSREDGKIGYITLQGDVLEPIKAASFSGRF